MNLLFVQCGADPKVHYPSDLEQGLISGPVTHLVTLKFEMDSTGNQEQLVEESIELFNEHGSSPSDTVRYLLRGEEEINVLYFNPNTSMKQKVTFIDGKKEYTMRADYSTSGEMVRIDILNASDSLQEYYNNIGLSENGEIAAAHHYNSEGKLTETFSNIYDQFTRIRAVSLDTNGDTIFTSDVEVNEKKWPVREISAVRAGVNLIYDTTFYKYDAIDHYGNWRVKHIFNEKNKPVRMVRKFTYKK